MPHAESIEELDKLKEVFENGCSSAVLLRDRFKESAKQVISSCQNEIRSSKRKVAQEQSRQYSLFCVVAYCVSLCVVVSPMLFASCLMYHFNLAGKWRKLRILCASR